MSAAIKKYVFFVSGAIVFMALAVFVFNKAYLSAATIALQNSGSGSALFLLPKLYTYMAPATALFAGMVLGRAWAMLCVHISGESRQDVMDGGSHGWILRLGGVLVFLLIPVLLVALQIGGTVFSWLFSLLSKSVPAVAAAIFAGLPPLVLFYALYIGGYFFIRHDFKKSIKGRWMPVLFSVLIIVALLCALTEIYPITTFINWGAYPILRLPKNFYFASPRLVDAYLQNYHHAIHTVVVALAAFYLNVFYLLASRVSQHPELSAKS